jgi:hypothetical protein
MKCCWKDEVRYGDFSHPTEEEMKNAMTKV